jgi:hypothetical protein
MGDCCVQEEPKKCCPPEICSPRSKKHSKPHTVNVEAAAPLPVAASPVQGRISYDLYANGVLIPDVSELCYDPCQPEGPPENFYIPCGAVRYNFLKEEYEWVYV